MSFVVGDRYERHSDGMTATVAQTDETRQNAVLRLDDGGAAPIQAADVPRHWRRYEVCPECLGTGKANELKLAKGGFSKLLSRPDCPRCGGSGRIYR
jgi:hypothetical protein